jgi:putative flippase GtrA
VRSTSLSRASAETRGTVLEAWARVPARSWGGMLAWLQRHEHVPLCAYAHTHIAQLVRFVVIGGLLAVFNLSCLYGLRAGLHLADAAAVTIMYVLGAMAHFAAHRWITYGAHHEPVRPQGLRYAAMLVWNFLVMQTVVALAARVSISAYFAVICSTGLTMVSNFLVMTHIVFIRRRLR